MIPVIHTLNIVLPILYLVTFLTYVYDFVEDKSLFRNAKRLFLFITILIQVFYLFARTIEFNHPPITNKFEIFTVLAFSLACCYFVLELITDIRGTGIFILFLSLVFQIISTIFIQDLVSVPEVLRNRMLGMHVISALLGYSGITISAVQSLLYLMLYHSLKTKKYGLIFNRLPNIEILEKLSFNSMIIGFILLTISIFIGIVWLPEAFPNFSYYDPKLITTALIWVLYSIGILLKLTSNLYGRKFVNFSIAGFIIALFSLILGNVLSSSFHTFY
ncbi:MAG TPA: cytochrome c biogenesis protein CcsA [Melioribacteraceae bacterium]|nr:cytochrome c biogenesis protein CcsA [Melioribacteraceae bacterium]